jgi:hypothetical protein
MGWVVDATLGHSTPGKDPVPICIGGWVDPGAGLDGCRNSLPNRDSIPDRPAGSESLHQLS